MNDKEVIKAFNKIAHTIKDEFDVTLTLKDEPDGSIYIIAVNRQGNTEYGVICSDLKTMLEELNFYVDYKRGAVKLD